MAQLSKPKSSKTKGKENLLEIPHLKLKDKYAVEKRENNHR